MIPIKTIEELIIKHSILEKELSSEKINDTANSLPILSKQIINEALLSFEDLNAICISAGPGSFTGLRIGMSYAKGIALALNIPIVPISTFDSLAHDNTIVFLESKEHLINANCQIIY